MILEREEGKEGRGRERDRNIDVREKYPLAASSMHIVLGLNQQPRYLSALTRDGTCNLLMHKTMLQPPGQGSFLF